MTWVDQVSALSTRIATEVKALKLSVFGAAGQSRVVLDNTLTDGKIEVFAGWFDEVAGTIRSYMDSIPTLGQNPVMEIKSGTAGIVTSPAVLLLSAGLDSGAPGELSAVKIYAGGFEAHTSEAYLIATDQIHLGAPSLYLATPVITYAPSVILSGGPSDTAQVASTGAATATSTTNVTIPGLSLTVTSPGPGAVYLISIDADISVTSGTNIVELLVDGVALTTPQIISTGNSSRRAGSKTWRVTGLSASTHTFTARTRNTAASTSAVVQPTHTVMRMQRAA